MTYQKYEERYFAHVNSISAAATQLRTTSAARMKIEADISKLLEDRITATAENQDDFDALIALKKSSLDFINAHYDVTKDVLADVKLQRDKIDGILRELRGKDDEDNAEILTESASGIYKTASYNHFLFPIKAKPFLLSKGGHKFMDDFANAEPHKFGLVKVLLKRGGLSSFQLGEDSDTQMVDPLLGEILRTVSKRANIHLDDDEIEAVLYSKEGIAPRLERGYSLCSLGSQPEYAIVSNHNVMCGSEAKGLHQSVAFGSVQCFQICADGMLGLLERGVASEDCVVPGLILAGGCAQVMLVYSTPNSPNLPSAQFVSRVLDLQSSVDVTELDCWMTALTAHVIRMANLLKKTENPVGDTRVIRHALELTGVFVKAISPSLFGVKCDFETRNVRFRPRLLVTERLLTVFQAVYDQASTADKLHLFNFPIGVTVAHGEYKKPIVAKHKEQATQLGLRNAKSVDNFSQVLLLPLLEGWFTAKPDQQFHSQYLDKLSQALSVVCDAQWIYMDVHPGNVMWRVTGDNELELKLIDFEDALPLDFPAESKWYSDRRYPLHGSVSPVRVTAALHEWSLLYVAKWLDSEVKTYMEFMSNGAGGDWVSFQPNRA